MTEIEFYTDDAKTEITPDVELPKSVGVHMGRETAWEVAREILGQLENEDTSEISFLIHGESRPTAVEDRF